MRDVVDFICLTGRILKRFKVSVIIMVIVFVHDTKVTKLMFESNEFELHSSIIKSVLRVKLKFGKRRLLDNAILLDWNDAFYLFAFYLINLI